jgi:hypothetical protein
VKDFGGISDGARRAIAEAFTSGGFDASERARMVEDLRVPMSIPRDLGVRRTDEDVIREAIRFVVAAGSRGHFDIPVEEL